jgi:hypothetical protein
LPPYASLNVFDEGVARQRDSDYTTQWVINTFSTHADNDQDAR